MVCVRGTLAGSEGTSLLLDVEGEDSSANASCRLRLEMPSDNKHLSAFENFQLLSTRKGLPAEVVGRVQLGTAGSITALCLEPRSDCDFALSVPEPCRGRYQVAFDSIQPHEIRRKTQGAGSTAQETEVVPSLAFRQNAASKPTNVLAVRMLNLLLGGRRSLNSVAARTLSKEQLGLTGQSQPTAATLHQRLQSAAESGADLLTTFAACHLYTQAATRSQNFSNWSSKALSMAD